MLNIKQLLLKHKYKKAKTIYCIFCWNGYGVLPAKWTGDIDEDGQPLTIHYSDCNGERELYYIAPWYTESTGYAFDYAFDEKVAKYIANKLNERDKNDHIY